MIDEIRFLVPNLDRRTDRWRYCEQSLLDQGVPKEMITRFPSVDGLAFLKDDNHFDTSLIDAYMKKHYYKWKPNFLNSGPLELTRYAWKSTWLLALQAIAQKSHDELTCFMIDDMYITAQYSELLNMVNALLAHCAYHEVPFLAAQLGQSSNGKNTTRLIDGCPTFQSGFANGCDHAFLYSGAGAMFVEDVANECDADFVDPVIVAKDIADLGDYPGVFGISGIGAYPSGVAFCDSYASQLKPHPDLPNGVSDHGRSAWEIGRKAKHK